MNYEMEIETLNRRFKNKILNFIRTFNDIKSSFLTGQCYWFAAILYDRFHNEYPCNIVYDPIINHFAVRIKDIVFDACGIANNPFGLWINWNEYIKAEPLESARIFRDCIFHYSPEEWEELPEKTRVAPWDYFYKGWN